MISYGVVKSDNDLNGILDLQKKNLANVLSEDELRSEGFVTVVHSFENLAQLNTIERHVIAKDEEKVIGYLLAMTVKSRNDIPVLHSMFEKFDEIMIGSRSVSSHNYIVVGQVCVARDYRGQGILDRMYQEYRIQFAGKYDFAITEIAVSNQRSINAHKRIGFTEVLRFSDSKTEWSVVLWNWLLVAGC